MNRRTIAFIITLVMLIGMIPLHTVFAAGASIADFTVIADKTTVKPGDEITFTVKVTASDIITSWSFKPDIPSGLSYVANSGSVDANLKTITESDGDVSFTEGSKLFYIDCSALDGLKGLNNLTIGTFKCVVDENAEPKDYNIGVAISEVCDKNADPYAKDKYESEYATVKVESKPVPATGFTLDKTSATVETGDETLTLTPIFSPENATNKNLTWTSSDNEIAMVADGIVTLIKKGVVTITATTEDGRYTASCVVTITCSHRKGNSYPAESSTCIKQGHEAYDICEECGEIINGSDAKLPLADHAYVEKAEAQYLKTAATCNSKAVYYKSCSVCGVQSNVSFFEYGEFDSSNHVGGTYIKDQKEATCHEEGYTGDTYCSDCNAKIASGTVIEKNAHNPASVWSTDKNYHWKECQTVGCGNIIDKAAHTGGEATCAKKAICSICGVEYGTVNVDNHKNTEIRNIVEATCTVDGYTGDTYCKDCGVKILDGAVIPAGHKLDKVDAKAATHKADGNIEYYICSVCSKLFKYADATVEIAEQDTVIAKGEHDYGDTYKTDAENHWKECGCGNIIEKAAHVFGDWNVVKEATATEKGAKERVCSVCGYKAEESIPAIGTATEPKPTDPPVPSDKDQTTKPADTDKTPEESPQTGDTSNLALWIALMFVSAAGIGSMTVAGRKKRVK